MLNRMVGFVTNQKIIAYFFQIVSDFLVVYFMFCSNRVIVFDICNVFGKNSKKPTPIHPRPSAQKLYKGLKDLKIMGHQPRVTGHCFMDYR